MRENKHGIKEFSLLVSAFFLVAIIFYFPTLDSRVVFDHVEYLNIFNDKGWSGIKECFNIGGVNGLYCYTTIQFILYKFFGGFSTFNGILAILIHSINSSLLVYLLAATFYKLFFRPNIFLSTWIGLLFLISPFHSEPVVWGATFHYLLLLLCLLLGLTFILSDSEKNHFGNKLGLLLVYNISLYLHEISFVYILVFFAFHCLIFSKLNFRNITLRFINQYGFILVSSLLICFFVRWKFSGDIIGHYGAKVHLRFDYQNMLMIYNLYILKYGFLMTVLSGLEFWKKLIHNSFAFYFFIQGIFLTIILSLSYKKLIRRDIGWILIIFSILIFPSLNLYFPDYLYIEGDRLGYVASFALFFLLAFIIHLLSGHTLTKKILYLYLLILTIFSGYKLIQYNHYWYSSSRLMTKLENTHFDPKTSYYFLNLPISYNGAYMYKTGASKCAFLNRLILKNKKENLKFHEILSMNLTEENNEVSVKKLSLNELIVNIENANGSWFWKGNRGAENHETKWYKILMNEWGTGYRIILKRFPSKSTLVYYSKGKFNFLNLKNEAEN